MAADQGLISASLKEAQSRVGPDKTGYYKAMVNIPVNLMTNAAEIFKQKEIKNNEAWENAAGNTEEMLNSLASEDQLGNMGQANIAHLKSLKKEFLAAGGNKDKENEVKIKIQKVVKTINKLAAGFGKYGEAYLSDTLDKKASDAEFTNVLGRIWEKDGEYGDVEFNWKENGDLDFVVDGFATSSGALFDKLILKNDETTNGLGKIGINQEKRGGNGLEYDRGSNIQQVKNLWGGPEGKKKFATTINSSTFGYESFIEALVNNPEIHKTLTDLGNFNYDNSEDKKVTADDFATDENKQQLINALTNVHSNTFDFETAKEIAGSWYSDSYLKSKYNDGKKSIKNNPNDKSGNYIIGKQSVPRSEIDPTVALLNSNKDYSSDTAWNGVVHKRENGKYFIEDRAEGKKADGYFVEVNKDTVANSIGIMSSRYGYKKNGDKNENDKDKKVTEEMFMGSADDVVEKFTDKYGYSGFEFDTEFDFNNRAMNISIGDKELEDINLDEEGVLEKIQKFIDDNSPDLG